ncbi:protein phosphatase 1, regulatory (inhibitor) subunit 14Aa isoform X2 [Echeneis naucrates]|uniref:protein phosphatase 1, regulatory (inhibitor) subunit 14Aa isoform X2 n=1 Tax=Echeneis naucrates TaxID=173247 RepID=UPI001113E553|nr:protein phosphatase 1 regulatory subunit 14C-like isoform X2 [Echeneis naucrates]
MDGVREGVDRSAAAVTAPAHWELSPPRTALPPPAAPQTSNQSDQSAADMADEPSGTAPQENEQVHSSDGSLFPDHGCNIPKRHARVTVKYNRKELQRRLDVEKWIDEGLDRLYSGQEADMPEEVNIDDLIDLPNQERVKKLQELLQKCSNNTETFITELMGKLEGVQKQDELQSEGIEHPVICHSHYRHEPYHFHNQQHHYHHHTRSHNQTL